MIINFYKEKLSIMLNDFESSLPKIYLSDELWIIKILNKNRSLEKSNKRIRFCQIEQEINKINTLCSQ